MNSHSLRTITILLAAVVVVALAAAACRQSTAPPGSNSAGPSTPAETTTAPPYPANEPERYQATVTITSKVNNPNSPLSGMPELLNREMLVARDGASRRTDTELVPGVRVVFLRNATASYILAPAKNIYCENTSDSALAKDPSKAAGASIDNLITDMRKNAQYQKIGEETLSGRRVTKYRVSADVSANKSTDVKSETIVWFDESISMAVKAQMTTTGGPSAGTVVTMEMRDFRTDVDPALFELPKGYRKVSPADIFTLAASPAPDSAGSGSAPKKTP